MMWRTLTNQIVRFAHSYPEHPGVVRLTSTAKARDKTVQQYLDGYDIREVGTLRLMVREAFPKNLQNVSIISAQDYAGRWKVRPLLRYKTVYRELR